MRKSSAAMPPSAQPIDGTRVGKLGQTETETTVETHPLARVLAVEDKLRSVATEIEFQHSIANDLRSLVSARQVIVFKKTGPVTWRAACISSMASVERDSPFIRFIDNYVKAQKEMLQGEKASLCVIEAAAPEDRGIVEAYPFREGIWQSIRFRNGEVFAGLLFLREKPWSISEIELVQREAPVISDIWCAIAGRRSLKVRSSSRRMLCGALAAAALASMAVPVPLTTLAPVEIVADNPFLVTAPINGVIDKIHVDPNRYVKKGQPLVDFVDTDLRNEYELARRAADVAVSRHARISQAAFSDEKSRHELRIAATEMTLKIAERDYAHERLQKITIRAQKSGLLIYARKSRWIGHPVTVGERLMRIAAPDRVKGRVALPVADAIVLKQGARARLFLDVDPTQALEARIETESYHAGPDAAGQLVFHVQTRLDSAVHVPRIGSRGVAQLFGAEVPLGFFLFRRPIASLRQTLGF